jgi:release factor glutamine methyltransferase
MFLSASLDSPDLDARLLIEHALGLDRTALVGAADRTLTPAEADRINALAARRLARAPVALIVGETEFWGLPLHVTAATLVPRPDTETIVEAALSLVDAAGRRTQALRIADLGTGSGAILLALLSELPNAFGYGADRSFEAARVARNNACRLGLHARAGFMVGDFSAALAGGFDLVVSNPPYIATAEIETLMPEVRDHEPRTALDGGPDGLAAYRTIAADALRLLAPGGRLVVELGSGQEEAVRNVFLSAGLSALRPAVHDLSGIPRALPLAREDEV